MKNNKKIPERSLQVLACAIAVGVMILLLSGDIFMSKILRVNPNQDYPYDKENTDDTSFNNLDSNDKSEEKNDNAYDVSFMKEVNLTDLDQIIQNEEKVFVFSGRSTCPPCRMFVPILQKVVKDLDLKHVYYLNQSNIKSTTEGYSKFVSYSLEIQENFGTTPYFMIFQNADYKEGVIGFSANDLETLLKEVVLKY